MYIICIYSINKLVVKNIGFFVKHFFFFVKYFKDREEENYKKRNVFFFCLEKC